MNEAAPTRRRKATAVAVKERNLFMQIVFHSPKDTLAGAVAVAAVLAIIANAVFLQAGRHPSPLFGKLLPAAKTEPPQVAAPRTAALVSVPAPQIAAPQQLVPSPMPRPRPAEAEMRPGDPLGNLVRSTSLPTGPVASAPRPPASIPAVPAKAEPTGATSVSSQRVAAVQRALTDYGYGQLKATGTVGADTQAAIQKFEREHKLPLTGQVSERLVRELGLATGRKFD